MQAEREMMEIYWKNRGASPKSGDIAFGARTALDFKRAFSLCGHFRKNGRVPEKNFQREFFSKSTFSV